MSDKIKEAIELLGKAKKEVFEVVASEMVGLIIQPIEDALSLLKPPCQEGEFICEKCGEKLPIYLKAIHQGNKSIRATCKGTPIQPDCSPSAKFVKEAIKTIKESRQTHIEWAAFFTKNLILQNTEEYKRLGGAGYQKECVEKYNQVITAFEQLQTALIAKDETIAAHAEALNPIREWYGGGTEGVRSDLEILIDAIADLQTDRKEVLAQAEQIKGLKKALNKYGKHSKVCRTFRPYDICSCGFDEALKGE